MTMAQKRRSGLLIPLFAAPSQESWGIGDIGDIARLTEWLALAGQRILQLLPLNEMASGGQSPYSAMSAMAIDPIYIRVTDIAEFQALGGEASLNAEDRERLAHARAASKIEYHLVRPVKDRALHAAFERFVDYEWPKNSARAAQFQAYIEREAWWLDDYALFRALHEREKRSWAEWPDGLAARDPRALARARRELSRQILFYQYLQWIAGSQWEQARAAAGDHGVALFGDLPFLVDLHSADVWSEQEEFELDRSVGVPPDAFSATGQDWGMPPYNWTVLARNGYHWLHSRARRSAALYDGYRVDHLVGFFRTFSRPRVGDGEPLFSPSKQVAQLRLGERVLNIFREAGSEIIAEDLGTVPDFVRAALTVLGIPGFRVLRWEREWDEEGKPFRDPVQYPVNSVATTGTHDTEPLVTWWEGADDEERKAVVEVSCIRAAAGDVDLLKAPFVPAVRDALLEAMFASASSILLLPVQDVFGWRDRINEPATVNDDNWSFRLPWPIDTMASEPEARERQAALRQWAERHGRV